MIAILLLLACGDPPGRWTGADTFEQLSAGVTHTCGLRTSGDIACWGRDDRGQSAPPGGIFDQVAVGSHASCALADGRVTCWGGNLAEVPPPETSFVQITGELETFCGLTADGAVSCWGDGALDLAEPPDEALVQIDVASEVGCGVTTDARALCWTHRMDWPEPATGFYSQVEVGVIACGRHPNNRARCWGPVNFEPSPGAFVDLSVHGGLACGVRATGEASCWGPAANSAQRGAPQDRMLVQVTAGATHACALQDDGRAVCWGIDAWGEAVPP